MAPISHRLDPTREIGRRIALESAELISIAIRRVGTQSEFRKVADHGQKQRDCTEDHDSSHAIVDREYILRDEPACWIYRAAQRPVCHRFGSKLLWAVV